MSTSVIRLTVPKLCQNAIDFGRIGHILWSGAPSKLLKTGPGSEAVELLELDSRAPGNLYRLADFPTTERPDLMLWYLWSKNRQEIPEGIYSHETALSLTLGVRQWSEPLK